MGGEENGGNGRVEYLREDFLKLSQEMKESFSNLEKKIDDLRSESSNENKEMAKSCSEKREKIYVRLEENEQAIGQLDKKIFRVFLIGNGMGFAAGVILTVIISRTVGGG